MQMLLKYIGKTYSVMPTSSLSLAQAHLFHGHLKQVGVPCKEAHTYEGKWLGQLEFPELALLHPHQLYGVRIGIPSFHSVTLPALHGVTPYPV